jgi:lipoate synthase
MILGDTCTRDCGFCAVRHGVPGAVDEDEPRRIGQAAAELGLDFVVVTSVTRDDLADGGAGHFAATIRALREAGEGNGKAGILRGDEERRALRMTSSSESQDKNGPKGGPADLRSASPFGPSASQGGGQDESKGAAGINARPTAGQGESQGEGKGGERRGINPRPTESEGGIQVEVLVPDFRGSREALATVLAARPTVLNHNVETIERLHGTVRPQADYRRSLGVLAAAKEMAPDIAVKSGFMVGLGETDEEVRALLEDLRGTGCDLVTIGQYLRPTRRHLAVERYVEPEGFASYAAWARELGFAHVASGPFVRSSYQAAEAARTAKAHTKSRAG